MGANEIWEGTVSVEVLERTIDPLGLVGAGGRWYLLATRDGANGMGVKSPGANRSVPSTSAGPPVGTKSA